MVLELSHRSGPWVANGPMLVERSSSSSLMKGACDEGTEADGVHCGQWYWEYEAPAGVDGIRGAPCRDIPWHPRPVGELRRVAAGLPDPGCAHAGDGRDRIVSTAAESGEHASRHLRDCPRGCPDGCPGHAGRGVRFSAAAVQRTVLARPGTRGAREGLPRPAQGGRATGRPPPLASQVCPRKSGEWWT